MLYSHFQSPLIYRDNSHLISSMRIETNLIDDGVGQEALEYSNASNNVYDTSRSGIHETENGTVELPGV